MKNQSNQVVVMGGKKKILENIDIFWSAIFSIAQFHENTRSDNYIQ